MNVWKPNINKSFYVYFMVPTTFLILGTLSKLKMLKWKWRCSKWLKTNLDRLSNSLVEIKKWQQMEVNVWQPKFKGFITYVNVMHQIGRSKVDEICTYMCTSINEVLFLPYF